MHARARLGRAVEDAAARLYEREGFLVARNYRVGRIEIDLVAFRPDLVVFCEVKARVTDRFGSPAEAVNWQKQNRIRRAAAAWLSENRPGAVAVRFDVVSAIVRGDRFELERIESAF
ncbi:MAG: YraN family protein [Actinomycetota bacterium]|nr:YraN family protein [Actinomycetota bacterium]